MGKSMKKMRNCPFCNERMDADNGIYGVHFNELLGEWVFSHNCHKEGPTLEVTVTVYAKTKEEAIDRWNGGDSDVEVDLAD
jgi:hypothetical protein